MSAVVLSTGGPAGLTTTRILAQTATPWDLHVHSEVLALVVALIAAYLFVLRRYGGLFHPRRDEPAASGRQKLAFAAGIASIVVALGWPLHDLGDNYLFSAHMVQHLILGFVTAPLLLLGTPQWMARLALGQGRLRRAYRWLARPLPAAIAFNVVLVFVHWPKVVGLMVSNDQFHAVTHLAFLAAGLLMWSVLYSPLQDVAGRISPAAKMLYLFVQTIIPTVPASFLTFGDAPLYRVYETFPRLWGISPIDDMQLAGLIMKLGGGLLLWSIIAVQFFRWADSEAAIGRGTGGQDDTGGGGGNRPEAPDRPGGVPTGRRQVGSASGA